MILPDVNVLIYAFRRDTPQHAVCRAWLDSVISGDARFGMSPLALGAVVRISTDSRIYAQPSTKDEAFGFCDDLLDQANCQVVEPGERHWDIFRRLCIETDTRGRVSPMHGTPLSRSRLCSVSRIEMARARCTGALRTEVGPGSAVQAVRDDTSPF
jgi:uncharacterized protein